ncbi:hypothetical protein RRG08_000478 [Elysia crispata]|uniref:Uncharacterized protein n=1 Tax=Elysia crispata TaxID=231223 RepID=A0AAE0YC29_9GAST|nr:hypothetical protein RRG08_000478 [Elysia crispata]
MSSLCPGDTAGRGDKCLTGRLCHGIRARPGPDKSVLLRGTTGLALASPGRVVQGVVAWGEIENPMQMRHQLFVAFCSLHDCRPLVYFHDYGVYRLPRFKAKF